MYPAHRGMGGVPPGNGNRINELLDQIRAEFDSQVRASESYEHQSECRPPPPSLILPDTGWLTIGAVQAQVNEMQMVREKVYNMEQTHLTLKQK